MDKLYLIRAKRFVDADPYRGIEHSGYNYSQEFLVVATHMGEGSNSVLEYLGKRTRYKNWERDSFKELEAGSDLPLEKRLEILGEVFKRLPQ